MCLCCSYICFIFSFRLPVVSGWPQFTHLLNKDKKVSFLFVIYIYPTPPLRHKCLSFMDSNTWTHQCWLTCQTDTYQCCGDTGCYFMDLPRARVSWDGWQERVEGICAVGMPWWWWWVLLVSSTLKQVLHQQEESRSKHQQLFTQCIKPLWYSNQFRRMKTLNRPCITSFSWGRELISWLVPLFNEISFFVGYLMPKPSLQKNNSDTIKGFFLFNGISISVDYLMTKSSL